MEISVNKVPSGQIEVGDIVSITHYCRVKSKCSQYWWSGPQDVISVTDLDGRVAGGFDIKGRPLIDALDVADRFTSEQTVTMTEAAQVLISSNGRPFKVCFTKANGEERVLRGYFIGSEELLGRSKVIDLDLDPGANRVRLVDHRTVRWLIVGGTKYIVKGKE